MVSSSESAANDIPNWNDIDDETRKMYKARHDECSKNIRGIGLALLSYALFCFLTLLQPDSTVFQVDQNLAIPFGNLPVGSITFLWVGPLILIILTSYLHIFISEWLKYEWIPHGQKLPYVFNLETRFSRALTYTIFYFIPPIILLTFVQKAQIMGKHWVSMLAAMGLLCTLVLLSLFHKIKGRKPHFYFKVSPLLTVFLFFVYLTFGGEIYHFVPINISKTANLREIDFRNYHLNKLNAEEAHLENAQFSGNQHLRHSNFTRAYLSGTSFEKANLHGAIFHGTNLRDTKLKGAILSRANFTLADLSALDLSGSFSGSSTGAIRIQADTQLNRESDSSKGSASQRTPKKLTQPTGDQKPKSPKDENKSDPQAGRTNLEHAILDGALIKSANLSGANLKKASFKKAILTKTNLSHAHLMEADFTGANLAGVLFTNADLTKANLTGAAIEFADFRGAIGMETVTGLTPNDPTARNWDRALFENSMRNTLNITNTRLLDIIPEFVDYHFSLESQEFKNRQIRDLKEYYELGDQDLIVSNIMDNAIHDSIQLLKDNPFQLMGSRKLELSPTQPASR